LFTEVTKLGGKEEATGREDTASTPHDNKG
jgi:hypothetical protein